MEEITLPTGNIPAGSYAKSAMPGVITTKSEELFAMARKSSLWTLTFGLAALAIVFILFFIRDLDSRVGGVGSALILASNLISILI